MQLKNYDKAQIVAQNYLSAYPNNEHAAEMYRILGDAYYHFGQYHQAVEASTITWIRIARLPAGMPFICWDSPTTKQKYTPKQPKH